MTITVILPWPAAGLSPNSRAYWRGKAAMVKQARMDAGFMAMEQAPGAKLPKDAPLSMSLLFCRPTPLTSALKSLILRLSRAQGRFFVVAYKEQLSDVNRPVPSTSTARRPSDNCFLVSK